VQTGEQGHYHPPLRGVVDARGKTTLRQFVRLVYHASGVLCPNTSAMHLAAAVEVKSGNPSPRPCVVVAGGREPVNWYHYPGHHAVHTIGKLSCCATGGCWRCRTLALNDGLFYDDPRRLCTDVVNGLPHCMDLIRPEQVIAALEAGFNSASPRAQLAQVTAAQKRRFSTSTRQNSSLTTTTTTWQPMP
jgi:ADP-heptose:LPS heptosyltransferase